MKTVILQVGDRIYYNNVLCVITAVRPDGVMVRHGITHRFVFASDLVYRDFEWCIVFKKDGNEGLSHTDDEYKKNKEIELLESIGYTVTTYKREVRRIDEGQ